MNKLSVSRLLIYLSLFMFLLLAAACRQDSESGIGYQELTIIDPATGEEIDVSLWFPTDEPVESERLGPMTAELAIGASPKQSEGLIVLSHGFAGDALSHHDTAVYLAQNGFLVAAPTHADLAGVESDNPMDDPLVVRPRTVSLLIDYLEADELFGSAFVPEKIGIIGYSIGSYTALAALGGQPTFSELSDYCNNVPADEILCAEWSEARFNAITDLLDFGRDDRIQAAVLLAPAYGPLFDESSLASVTVLIKIYQAEHDEELIEPYHVDRLRKMLPTEPGVEVIAGAGHYVFLSPCTQQLIEAVPFLCVDPDGVDREAVHMDFNTGIVQFFTGVFGQTENSK